MQTEITPQHEYNQHNHEWTKQQNVKFPLLPLPMLIDQNLDRSFRVNFQTLLRSEIRQRIDKIIAVFRCQMQQRHI